MYTINIKPHPQHLSDYQITIIDLMGTIRVRYLFDRDGIFKYLRGCGYFKDAHGFGDILEWYFKGYSSYHIHGEGDTHEYIIIKSKEY